ncbi:E3 ubiquitin-protein ligase RNF38-like [Poecile atricapillus]|uniref:E3 ubiquitin-protein ligase RNF38-like n=1 Tax=Poecile atricapillus TaxID=48891 RepID=UPI00273A55F7|nr:E3 ubiquitin-protein ligase RNF38-like [Poecile atricapillus]
MQPWEMTSNRHLPLSQSSQHHLSGERCSTPAQRRKSPPVHHQRARRDRLSRHSSVSQDENFHHLSYEQQQAIEESQAFNPPNISHHMLHSAGHSSQQNTVMVDIRYQIHQGAVPISYTVTTVAPHGIPLCTAQHIQPCSTQQVPGCSVVFSGQHLPICSVPPPMLQACSVQHLPVPYAAFPPLISNDPFILYLLHLCPHHPSHLTSPGQFVPFQAQQPHSKVIRESFMMYGQTMAMSPSVFVTNMGLRLTQHCAAPSKPRDRHPHRFQGPLWGPVGKPDNRDVCASVKKPTEANL